MWVVSFEAGLRSPAEVDALIERATAANINTIVAQVRRNAQGLYAKSPEGWLENYVPPTNDFDPLQDLIDKAHAARIEVHAWVNVGAIFSGNPLVGTASFPCRVPCNPNHIFNRHGHLASDEETWLTRTHPTITVGTSTQFPGLRTSPEGLWFQDLGHPAAADYTIGVLTELLRDYDVDGIHLDYIRYPDMPALPTTTNPPRPPGVSILNFSIGYNPTSVKRFNLAFNRTPGTVPTPWDASWTQWRRDQVTSFVRRLYLEMGFIRPSAKLSAALITFFRAPNTSELPAGRTFQQTEAYTRVYQDWAGWMKEGILDLSIPMIYKTQHTTSGARDFREWSTFTKDSQYNRHGVLGLGSYLNSLENSLIQINEGRTASPAGNRTQGFNIYVYHLTNASIPGRTSRPRDEMFRALTVQGAYGDAPFSEAADVPVMTWKSEPRAGHLLAKITGADGRPADGARVTIAKVGAGPQDEAIVQFADGNGYVGGVDLNPGAYQLLIQTPGTTERVTIPQPVVPGRVTRMAVDLRQPARGPMVRPERELGEHERIDQFGEEESTPEERRGSEPIPEDMIAPDVQP